MMYSLTTILLAQLDSRLQSFSNGFRRDRAQFDSGDIILLLSGFVVVFSILWLLARWSERRVRNDSSLGLFWTLAKTHGIGWSDRWLLWRLARAKRVAEPALLFLDPRLTSPQSSHHLAPHSSTRLKALRRRLFSGIQRSAEAPSEPIELEANPREPATTSETRQEESHLQADPAVRSTGGLEEALSALRALNLQEQVVHKQEPAGSGSSGTEEKSTPTAEFPSANAPVLDLYPWLGNDWELDNSDD